MVQEATIPLSTWLFSTEKAPESHFPSKSTVSIHTPVRPPTGERHRFQEMLREGTGPGRPFDIVLVLDDTRLPRLGDDFDRYGDQFRLNLVKTWTIR